MMKIDEPIKFSSGSINQLVRTPVLIRSRIFSPCQETILTTITYRNLKKLTKLLGEEIYSIAYVAILIKRTKNFLQQNILQRKHKNYKCLTCFNVGSPAQVNSLCSLDVI